MDKKTMDGQMKASQANGTDKEKVLPKKVLVLRLFPQAKDQKERVFKFDKERIVLGSVVSADVRLSGDGVEPIHAVIEMNIDPKTGTATGTLFDLASQSGVFVNDKRIVAEKLKESDRITIGLHQL